MTTSKMKLLLLVLTFAIFSSIIFAQAPGQISTNVKYIDADEMSNFQDGVSIIRKGNSFAVIDKSGEIVIPFNKYLSIEHDNKGSNILIVSKNVLTAGKYEERKYGLINTAGKEILACIYGRIKAGFDKDGFGAFAQNNKPNEPTVFVNSQGNKIVQIKQYGGSSSFSENLRPATNILSTNYKYGYVDRTGKIKIPFEFDEAYSFNEGLACVCKKNEFGEKKYGFINKDGKTVIPFQFSNQPSDFSCGLALVEPVSKDDFNFAYINRGGQIVIKVKNAPNGKEFSKRLNYRPEFVGGYSQWKTSDNNIEDCYLIDTLGNIVSEKDFLLKFGIKQSSITNSIIFDKYSFPVVKIDNRMTFGFINIKTGKSIPVLFRSKQYENTFDPVSKLFLTYNYDSKLGKIIHEGFINEDGVYVIIKGSAGKW